MNEYMQYCTQSKGALNVLLSLLLGTPQVFVIYSKM